MADQPNKKKQNKPTARSNNTNDNSKTNNGTVNNNGTATRSNNNNKKSMGNKSGLSKKKKLIGDLDATFTIPMINTSTTFVAPAPKVNKTAEMLETIPTTVVNNNLDDVLATVKQLDNTCDFMRCRTKTSLIGQDCSLCQQRFCMKHQLPEVHGCGGAVKKSERTEFLRPRQTLPISAALRRNEQKDAHARLEQKIKEMSLARQKARK